MSQGPCKGWHTSAPRFFVRRAEVKNFPAVPVGDPKSLGDIFRDFPEALFAFSQCSLGLFSLGDVARHHHQVFPFKPDQSDADLNRKGGSILAPVDSFRSGGSRFAIFLHRLRPV